MSDNEEIVTGGKNFTLPPAVTALTNPPLAVDDDNDKTFKKNNDNVGGKKKLVGWGKWGRGRDRGAVPTWFTNTLLPPTLRLGEIFSGISYPHLFLVTGTFAKSMYLI